MWNFKKIQTKSLSALPHIWGNKQQPLQLFLLFAPSTTH